MSKRLTSIPAGALIALAFALLPGAASAEEAKVKCESGAPCEYTVEGGESKLSLVGGDTLKCTSVFGAGEMINLDANNEATTGELVLLFLGCKEQSTIFHFSCSNTETSGSIETNTLVTHNVKLPGTTRGQGVLVTGWNTTLTCAGAFASTQLTGNLLGELDEACGHTGKEVHQVFNATADGQQTLKTYTGNTYDLEAKTSHSGGGSYETAALTGTTKLIYDGNVEPTC
jgi:hypothetical protein